LRYRNPRGRERARGAKVVSGQGRAAFFRTAEGRMVAYRVLCRKSIERTGRAIAMLKVAGRA
jgi:hypothetical protein